MMGFIPPGSERKELQLATVPHETAVCAWKFKASEWLDI